MYHVISIIDSDLYLSCQESGELIVRHGNVHNRNQDGIWVEAKTTYKQEGSVLLRHNTSAASIWFDKGTDFVCIHPLADGAFTLFPVDPSYSEKCIWIHTDPNKNYQWLVQDTCDIRYLRST